ncbi:hypothetical protein GCM10011491_46800 [Brucella endophytica]|uniref:Uncharacterized protein n=1 Tax=Brucella endophytica TaxID=1963359 RepID=A0A916SU56_9HYPH|nr:hypothetical protein GCM10011491_46800 [Brucella endophytica]
MFTQPGSEAVGDRTTFFLTGDTTVLVGPATYLVFDPVKFGDAFERLAGDGCGTGGRQLIEAASNVGPAEGQRHGVLCRERAISTVAVDLQDADEAVEMGHRSFAFAIWRIDIGDTGRVIALPRPVISCISQAPYGRLHIPSQSLGFLRTRLRSFQQMCGFR